MKKEREQAEKGGTTQNQAVTDSDEEEKVATKKQPKRNKNKQAEGEFNDEEAKEQPAGELEANFEGIGKKNTRKKKQKE